MGCHLPGYVGSLFLLVHCPPIFSRILYCKEAGAQSNGVSPVAVATMNHYAISQLFSLFPKRTNFTSTTVKYYKALNKSHPLPLSFSLSFPRELTIIFHHAHFHFLLQKKRKSKWMLQAHMSSRLITIWFLWVLRIVFTFSQFLYNDIHIS